MPRFELNDLDGKVFKSSRLNGSVVLLDLWATWCEPCLADIPIFNRLHEKFNTRGLKVVGIAVESGWAKDIKPHVARTGIQYPVLVGTEKIVQRYGMIGFPTRYLIGKEGNIIKKYVGTPPGHEGEIEREIEALLQVDPLTGSWKGDWGPSPTDRNTVTLDLKWDGKTLTGTVNPGPDAIAVENASFDPKTMQVHIEANFAPRNLRYVVDGTVENDKMSGTWSRPGRKGDFQLSREEKKAQAEAVPGPNLAGLNASEKRVVQYLLGEWNDDYNITSVDVAMQELRLQPSDEARFRIGSYLKQHPEIHSVIRQWGWETVALTTNEKLVARAIVNAERDRRKAPSVSDLAKSVRISEKGAESAVRILDRFRILKRNKPAGGVGYIAAAPRYLNWQPWLDFQFHRLTLSSGRIFNTN